MRLKDLLDFETIVIQCHNDPDALPQLREVRSNYGACSVIIWDMLCQEGFDVRGDIITEEEAADQLEQLLTGRGKTECR